MKNAKLIFDGNVWAFLWVTLGLIALGMITAGIAFLVIPFFQIKYMIENTRIEFKD